MSAGRDREDQVIEETLKLLARYFPDVTLVERPDLTPMAERTHATLTTDALVRLKIDSLDTHVAIDVTILASSRKNLAYSDLANSLDGLATTNGVKIHLLATDAIDPLEVESIVASLTLAVGNSPKSGSVRIRNGVDFNWRTATPEDGPLFDLVAALHGPSGSLTNPACSLIDLVAYETSDVLQKKTKTNGQVERTKNLGLPYILVLDGTGSDEVVQGTQWLPTHPYTFQQGILKALGENEPLIDGIILLNRDGEFSVLKMAIHGFDGINKELGV